MSIYQADLVHARDLLRKWLMVSTESKGTEWINQKIAALSQPVSLRDFYTAFGMVPRMVGRLPLAIGPDDLAAAHALRPGLDPSRWTTDQAARVLVLLLLPHQNVPEYTHALGQLFTTAEMAELTALYLALPLLPHPGMLRGQASEGVRTNLSGAFNALALDNPYSADYLDEPAWNQLVLKAVFVGSPLHRVVGLDRRANARLARILCDFAHERWAAGRAVSPEIWRVAAPFADDAVLPDLDRLLAQGTEAEQTAAALLAVRSGHAALLATATAKRPDLVRQAQKGAMQWPKG